MTSRCIPARPILAGTGQGQLLKIPGLSLWGGVDPHSGRLTDPSIDHFRTSVRGRILAIGEPRGSSSSSAVMLELLRNGCAPAAIVLGRIDAIVGLGIVVARELGWPTIPLLLVDPASFAAIPDGSYADIPADGGLHIRA